VEKHSATASKAVAIINARPKREPQPPRSGLVQLVIMLTGL
jgi:hypothetical protein